jgi:hypothetical protein
MHRMLLGLATTVAFTAVSAIAQGQNKPASTPIQQNSAPKIFSYSAFMAQLRQALAARGVDLGAYKEDIAIISDAASRCPKSMPITSAPGASDMDGDRNKYNKSSVSRACEMTPLTSTFGVYRPIVSGSEPRKLYVDAHAMVTPLPGSNRAAYRISIMIEKQSPDQWLRTDELLSGIIIPDVEIEVAKRRSEGKLKERQETEAVVEEETTDDAELKAARQQGAAVSTTPRDAFPGIATAQNTAGLMPTDDEITSAIVGYWTESNNQKIAELQNKINSAMADADKNHYEARAKAAPAKCASESCFTTGNGACFKGKKPSVNLDFRTGQPDGYSGCTRCIKMVQDECMESETSFWRTIAREMGRWKEEIQDLTAGSGSAKARADNQVFAVVSKNNYEGNIICYVNMRAKGTDNIAQIKLTIQDRANRWVVIRYEAVSG